MNNKSIFYSCCTRLSYEICQRHYGAKHYAWCSPCFDASSPFSPYNLIPPSSNPRDIYWSLKRDVDAADLHSAKIRGTRLGIQKGARLKLNAGMINDAEHREILKIVQRAQPADFTPVLYVIPVTPIRGMFGLVPLKNRASLLSEEYIVENLPRYLFDVIEL